MSKKQTYFSKEEKANIVSRSKEAGVIQASKIYNISASTIYRWKKEIESSKEKNYIRENININDIMVDKEFLYQPETSTLEISPFYIDKKVKDDSMSIKEFFILLFKIIAFIPILIWNIPRLIKHFINGLIKVISKILEGLVAIFKYAIIAIVVLIALYLIFSSGGYDVDMPRGRR